MDFYLYLPSNTGDFMENKLSSFKVKLPTKVDLEGEWEVALVEISYPITWLNIGSDEEAIVSLSFADPPEYRQKTIPHKNYDSIDSLCDALNFTLDNMVSFSGNRTNFIFAYDIIRHRVGLKPLAEADKSNVEFIRLSPQLQYMLGFKNRELTLEFGKLGVLFKGSEHVSFDNVELSKIKWSTRSDDEDIEMFQYLNSILSRLKDTHGQTSGCALRYFPLETEIVLESSDPRIMQLNISDSLQCLLGLTDNVIYPNVRYKVKERGYLKAPDYFLMAEGAPDISAGQYALFVYCDVVRPQIIGNALSPILRAVSIRGRYGDIIDELYDSPHYVPVLKREFGIIEINISDDRGRLVNFEYGKLFVKLHFRMKT